MASHFHRQKPYSPAARRFVAAFLIMIALVLGIYDGASLWNKKTPPRFHLKGRLAEPYRLGLDLEGGAHLVYQADFSNINVGDKSDAMQGLRDVVERRVNAFGVGEPVVQVNQVGSNWRLIVELPGEKDIQAAIRYIGATPLLEFRELRDASSTERILALQSEGKEINTDPYFLPAELTGRYLKKAVLEFDPTTNAPTIAIEFDSDGAQLFEEVTKRNIGNPVGIYLDGIQRSAPTVQEQITGGKAVITGQFTLAEAQSIVRDLNSGALPVPVVLMSQQTVDASLGAVSLLASLKAGLIGFIIVAIFMIFWYRLPGILAVFALGVYTSIILALFKIFPVTLTVAGIAGFVLSIGMAVDANILIFERMKEELRRGRALPDAVSEGFLRAWTSIRDSNFSSLITAAVLYYFGTSVVRGFAVTLFIGIIISMFTALTVTRTFLLATLRKSASTKWYLSGFSKM